MKHTFIALLKFNLFCGFLIFIFYLYTVVFNNKVSDKAQLFIILMFVFIWFIQNVTILLTNRKRIAHSILDKTIDIAASTMELRDAARARIQERIEERKR